MDELSQLCRFLVDLCFFFLIFWNYKVREIFHQEPCPALISLIDNCNGNWWNIFENKLNFAKLYPVNKKSTDFLDHPQEYRIMLGWNKRYKSVLSCYLKNRQATRNISSFEHLGLILWKPDWWRLLYVTFMLRWDW